MLKTEEPRTRDVTQQTNVLIVDDHPIVRKGLEMLINHQPDLVVCGEAPGMAEAMKLFYEKQPAFVIVDISLNNGSGLELVREMMAARPSTKILVHSLHDEMLFAERALRAGAKGYINKIEATDRILEAIRCVQQGKIYLSDKMKERMLCRTVGGHKEEAEQSPVDRLSDRELEVFELLGMGDATKQIAEKLHLSPKTIESYRDNIKIKLNLENSRQLLQHAVQWVLEKR